MTNILIIEDENNVASLLETRFKELGNDVTLTQMENAYKDFENTIPDLIIMDFDNNFELAKSESRKILEMDHTACIFALTSENSEFVRRDLYASGIRVVVHPKGNTLDKSNIEPFMDDMYRSCNDLDHEKCVGCWATGRFDDLENIAR